LTDADAALPREGSAIVRLLTTNKARVRVPEPADKEVRRPRSSSTPSIGSLRRTEFPQGLQS